MTELICFIIGASLGLLLRVYRAPRDGAETKVPVYTSASGRRYVKIKELLKNKKVREQIKETAKLGTDKWR